jgi:hypothetical protein
MNDQFDNELSAALLGFNGEAVPYCQGISDTVALLSGNLGYSRAGIRRELRKNASKSR